MAMGLGVGLNSQSIGPRHELDPAQPPYGRDRWI
jgi:hypothetical protein